MQTIKQEDVAKVLNKESEVRYVKDSQQTNNISEIISVMDKLYLHGQDLTKKKSLVDAYIIKKELSLFFERKFDTYSGFVPHPLRSKVALLEKIKDMVKTDLPTILNEVTKKVALQAKPKTAPKNPYMQSTYMRDYADHAKISTGYSFPDIVAIYNEGKEKPEYTKKPEKIEAPLKPILYPSILTEEFIRISEKNTKNSIETCGVFCGIKKDVFIVTRIFIPEQTGTSDTCATLNYEEIEKYVSKHNLIVLGWIHTHPDYTCFLSSVDVHTQYGYQKLLPESIAVVYSGLPLPPDEKCKIFRLKDEYMDEIGKCKKSKFHKHSVPDYELFEECFHVEDYDPSLNGISARIDGHI